MRTVLSYRALFLTLIENNQMMLLDAFEASTFGCCRASAMLSALICKQEAENCSF